MEISSNFGKLVGGGVIDADTMNLIFIVVLVFAVTWNHDLGSGLMIKVANSSEHALGVGLESCQIAKE